jgi:FK506-binding protein 4/5
LFCDDARDVKLVYKTLKEKMREYNRRDAKFYGNMFAKWRKLEHMDTKVSSRAHDPEPFDLHLPLHLCH